MSTRSDKVGDTPLATDQRPVGPAASETSPQRLGSGSFASVYMIRSGTVAFKEVHQSHGEEAALLREFTTLERLYSTCDSDSFFMLPRPYAYCDPKNPSSFKRAIIQALPARRDLPVIGVSSLRPFTKPTYAMQRVHSLPLPLAKVISDMYFPEEQQHILPTTCRLYFGKVLPQRPGRFFNSANFPLDAARYSAIRQQFTDEELDSIGLSPIEAVAEAMGEMLGRLHLLGGCDARDVEFVLGGDGGEGNVFFVIDFNQVRTWDKTTEGIPGLVQAFFINDPYYPRPRPTDSLYAAFKRGYLDQYPGDVITLGQAVLQQLEAEQARRDSAS